MEINLFLSIYEDSNFLRRLELESCLQLNFKAGYDNIYLCIEEKDINYIQTFLGQIGNPKGTNIQVVNERPPFQYYINKANELGDNLNVVCNSDIYILPEDLNKIKNLDWSKKMFLALSRWDLHKGGTSTLLDRQDSQDCYIWVGKCDVKTAYCPIGVPGVDNSVCWKFHEMGYRVFNPSKDIKIFHLHNVLGNNYREQGTGAVKATQICEPPYYFAPTITIDQI